MIRRRIGQKVRRRVGPASWCLRPFPPTWWCGVNGFLARSGTAIISTVEDATGGRVEIGSFRLDWKTLRAEVQTFVLHGTEPPDKPPLFRATSVAVGLKIVSLLKRDVDIQYLDVVEPRVYLVVNPDGSTNMPQPKIKSQHDANAVETLIKLAIGRFSLQNGYLRSGGARPDSHRRPRTESERAPHLRSPRRRAIAAKSRSSPFPFNGPITPRCRLTSTWPSASRRTASASKRRRLTTG